MRINSIKVQNFKNFQNLDLKLSNFNVLIGQNASGKSSFIQLFKFIKDIKIHGLENAISLQGGIDYLRNINISNSMPLSIEINLSNLPSYLGAIGRSKISKYEAQILSLSYKFSLEFMKRRRNFHIIEDVATINLSLMPTTAFREFTQKYENNKEELKTWIKQNQKIGSIKISKKNGKIDVTNEIPKEADFKFTKTEFPFIFIGSNKRTLMLEQQYFLFPITDEQVFSQINFYDIDPKLPKKAVPLSGKVDLEFDGSNLATVLKNLISDSKNRKRFTSLMADLLPFVEKFNVESLADKSFLFKMQEKYSKDNFLPASLLSDGTVGVTALIVALHFEQIGEPAIIEEPERNLHPALISKLASMMKDVSKQKQLIITTHNLEVIKNSDIKDILFISRDDNGFSTINRPAEMEHVKLFLAQELGIEDLYLQNLLQ